MRRIDAVRDRGSAQWNATSGGTRARAGLWSAGVAGVVGPVAFTVTFLVLERLRSGEFSPAEQPVSALEAGPYGWVQQASFVVFGLLTLVFAVGLDRGLRPNRWGMAGPALLGLSGAALLLAAAIPLRQDAAGEVYDPGGHVVAGSAFFAASAVGLVVLSRRIAADPAWSSLARWTLAAGLTCAIAFVGMRLVAIPEGAPLHEWVGLMQRATILLALFPMRVALSLRLLQLRRRPR
jgi:hypothetical membrane protein